MPRRFTAFAILLVFALSAISCGSASAEAQAEPLPIVSGGTTEYIIVRNDFYHATNPAVRAAVQLRCAIKEVTGVEIGLTTDWDWNGDNTLRKEILVGDTNRPESIDAIEKLVDGQYIIKVYGDGTKIVIAGKNESGTEAAVQYFCENYLGYRSETDFTKQDELVLSIGLELILSNISQEGNAIPVGSEAEAELIWQDAGTVEMGKRKLAGSDMLIYKLTGEKGNKYKLELDIEGQYLVTVSTDAKTYSRLFAYSDEGYRSPRGKYGADLTEYFAGSETVYIRISDYNPVDDSSPAIYSINLIDESETQE